MLGISGWAAYAVALVAGYLLGSIPSGLLITKAAGLGDVRRIGSGNIGATNVLRTGNWALAAVTLVCDMLKGTAAVLIASPWGGDAALAGGLGAFLGHLFPAWLGFKGGKGIATYIGVLIGLYWPAALVFCALWLLVAAVTRYSSLSALIAALAAPVYLAVMDQWPVASLAVFMTAATYYKHAANISRLLAGQESKIGCA